jgi:hypothetical protein
MTYTVAGYKALHGERRVVSPYLRGYNHAVQYLADLSKDDAVRSSLVVNCKHYSDRTPYTYSYECHTLKTAIGIVDGINFLDGWSVQIEWL